MRTQKGEPLLLRSAELIGWALGGLEREIGQTKDRLRRLTQQANQLRARLTPHERRQFGFARKRRSMSAEARRRISQMMKKRWAERKRKA